MPRLATLTRSILHVLSVLLALMLAGCAAPFPTEVAEPSGSQVAPTILPDSAPAGYKTVNQQACLAADLDSVWIEAPQGHMIAWAPGENRLVYIGTRRSSGWYVGDLWAVAAPDYAERVQLTEDVRAFGGLTWSPDGGSLAFIALREDQLYTVMTIRADGTGAVDLFPLDLARTDQSTSLKSITGWQSDDLLRVITSCGPRCRQTVDYNAASAARTYSPDTEDGKVEDTLTLISPPPAAVSSLFSDVVLFAAAPDGKQFAYTDSLGRLWVISTGSRERFELSLDSRKVFELAWSPDSSALAVRADDRVLIFSLPCDPQSE